MVLKYDVRLFECLQSGLKVILTINKHLNHYFKMSGHLKSNGFKQTRNANKNAYYAVAKGKQIGIYMNW